MANKLEKPEWFPRETYSKKLTTEEWLYEIWKRNQFNYGKLIHPIPIHSLTQQQKIEFFHTIFEDKINDFLTVLRPQPGAPIKDLSVTDVLRLAHLLITSEWHQNNPEKQALEEVIQVISKEEPLTVEQKILFSKYHDMPWHIFHKNTNEEEWFPNREFTHLSGIPVAVDPSYNKEDSAKEYKKMLTKWVGKLHDIATKFDNWHESKILAVFDLQAWFKLQSIEYNKIDLHNFLWPDGRISPTRNELVNPYDDIDQIIELTHRVISNDVVRTLWIACESRKYQTDKKTATA